jgi:uncharacterized membrane protein
MQTLLIVYVGGGMLLVLISLPLIAGKIKPNYLYGFRVPATLEDPDLWYPANKYAAKGLLIVGLVMIGAGICLSYWPGISVDSYAWACLGVFVLSFSIVLVQSFRYIRRLQHSKSG